MIDVGDDREVSNAFRRKGFHVIKNPPFYLFFPTVTRFAFSKF